MEKKAGKRTVLLVTTSASFLTPFMGSSVNLALPSIGKELAMDAILLTWISTSYLLAAAIFLVPTGRVADLYGRKKIFSYGIMLFTASSFLLGISNSSAMFIALRILQGGGGAMIFGTGTAILTSVFPPGEKGKPWGSMSPRFIWAFPWDHLLGDS
jgi:MFS family permease